MVTRYGMSDHFGMVALETVNNAYLGGDTSLACSAETAARVDEEVIALVKSAYEKAKAILSGHEVSFMSWQTIFWIRRRSPVRSL